MRFLDLLNPFHEVHGFFSLITWLSFMFILLAAVAYAWSFVARFAKRPPKERTPESSANLPPSSTTTEADILDAGARRIYQKSWAELRADFERIGKEPSPDFTAAVMIAGALELLKDDPEARKAVIDRFARQTGTARTLPAS
jgi:hypothetical protein